MKEASIIVYELWCNFGSYWIYREDIIVCRRLKAILKSDCQIRCLRWENLEYNLSLKQTVEYAYDKHDL